MNLQSECQDKKKKIIVVEIIKTNCKRRHRKYYYYQIKPGVYQAKHICDETRTGY